MGMKEIKPEIFAGLGSIVDTYNEIFTNTEPSWKFTPFERVSRLEGFDQLRNYQTPLHENLLINQQFGDFVGLMAGLLHGKTAVGSIAESIPNNRDFLSIKRPEEIINRALTDDQIWTVLEETLSAPGFNIAAAKSFVAGEFVRDFTSRRVFKYDFDLKTISFTAGSVVKTVGADKTNNEVEFNIIWEAVWKESQCKKGFIPAMNIGQ